MERAYTDFIENVASAVNATLTKDGPSYIRKNVALSLLDFRALDLTETHSSVPDNGYTYVDYDLFDIVCYSSVLTTPEGTVYPFEVIYADVIAYCVNTYGWAIIG